MMPAKKTEFDKLAPVFGAAKQILHEYRCILLPDDRRLIKAYCEPDRAAGDLELTCNTMHRN